MLFVNYVLDLNNGFRAKVVVKESKDIYLEYMDYKSITMKCTKLRTPSYWWAINEDIKCRLKKHQIYKVLKKKKLNYYRSYS